MGICRDDALIGENVLRGSYCSGCAHEIMPSLLVSSFLFFYSISFGLSTPQKIVRVRRQNARRGCQDNPRDDHVEEKTDSDLQRTGQFFARVAAAKVCREQMVSKNHSPV